MAEPARLRNGEQVETNRETTGREPSVPVSKSPASIARAAMDGRRATLLPRKQVQPSLKVSSPNDPAEREAERVAAAVMAMPDAPRRPDPAGPGASRRSTLVAARQPARATQAAVPRGGVDPAVEGKIRRSASGGAELPPKTRTFFEPRFRADFRSVRIHTDANAKGLANRIGARAFTYGRHIFFNDGQYAPETQEGMALLAHELTHTIQQSETVQRQAARVPRVSERTPRQASRIGISDVLDYFADAAAIIPGFRMFTILIGFNPINMAHVEASAANILRAIVEFLPGGSIVTRVLDSYGIFDRVGSWIEAQLRTLGISGPSIRAALDRFIEGLGWRDIFRLGDVWRRARAIFADPIGRLIAFARSLFGEILRFVREAVLRPLARLAEGTRGYPLLKAVLGSDPVTGEPAPRTPETVIGGLLTLIGQQELWQNIQRANAIPRAWTWFQTALSGLMSLVRSIPGRFMAALRGLEIMDFVILPRAFIRLAATFGSFLVDFGAWALGTVLDLLKIIIEVVKPEIMPYVRRAAGAFNTIVRDPVRFVRTLVRAAVQGFRQFANNFLTHLRASLVGWLTGAMSGANIYIPQAFSLREILKFALSVLGLTWANIRSKLVRATSETVVVALETGFEIVRTLVTEGPAAAWQKILETLGNLREMVIGQVMTFVRSRIVDAAVTRLLSMLTPAGALIQAIIAIYNTIMFFVERLSQIGRVAASFIDAIATIAAGNIGPAANRVEQTMAGMLTLVISFLARIAGLGRVSEEVTRIINRIRQPVDSALDRVVAWIVEQARRLGRLVAGGARRAVARVVNWFQERRQLRLGDGATHTLRFRGNARNARLMLASVEMPVEDHLRHATTDERLSAIQQQKAQTALTFYEINLRPLSGTTIPDPPPANLTTLLRALPSNLNLFADRLREISEATAIPMPTEARPLWRGPALATLDLVCNRTSRGGGDAHSGNPLGWNTITRRGLQTREPRWERMHMISASYGGADHDRNLIPAPHATNTGSIVRDFERRVVRTLYGADRAATVRTATRSGDPSLFERLDARRAVIWLKTTSENWWPAQVDARTQRPICDDRTFVQSVKFEGGLHFPRDNAWAKDPTPLVTATVSIPQPNFSREYQPNFNSLGEVLMSRLCEIEHNYATDIIIVRGGTPATRPFTDFGEFRGRMLEARTRVRGSFREMLNKVALAYANGRFKWSD